MKMKGHQQPAHPAVPRDATRQRSAASRLATPDTATAAPEVATDPNRKRRWHNRPASTTQEKD